MTAIQHPERLDGAPFTRRAWWTLLGFVPSFALSFLIGESIISTLGYPTSGETPAPWWAALVAGIPALAVFTLPVAFAVYFGRRAIQLGDQRGRSPLAVSVAVAGAFILLNGTSALAIWLS